MSRSIYLSRQVHRPRRVCLHLESLETRLAPATLVNANTLTYKDFDGDSVTVSISKPVFTKSNINQVFTFDFNTGVNGSNSLEQQLIEINLTAVPQAAGASLKIQAVRGLVNVGFINASGLDLGSVFVGGDLSQIDAGANKITSIPALASLQVHSMGVSSGDSEIQGRLGSLVVASDYQAEITTQGSIGSIFIGGSLVGQGDTNSGQISSTGDMGAVRIGGDIVGGSGESSGCIISSGNIASVSVVGDILGGGGTGSGSIESLSGRLGSVKVNGSVVGGAGYASAVIDADSTGPIKIDGSIVGGEGPVSGAIGSNTTGSIAVGGSIFGGEGENSGELVVGNSGAITVNGSIMGGAGDISGTITAGNTGAITVNGSIVGGAVSGSGEISATSIGSLTVMGSLIGSSEDDTGIIVVTGNIGPLKIGGNIRGGDNPSGSNLSESGYIQADNIASVTIGGSIISGNDADIGTYSIAQSGSIRAGHTLGPVVVGGSLIGNATNPVYITALSQLTPTAGHDLAIAGLSVHGRVEDAEILAGYDVNLNPVTGEAQIGPVNVTLDWIDSDLLAGAFEEQITVVFPPSIVFSKIETNDNSLIQSSIASISIGGEVISRGSYGVTEYAFSAELITSLKIGGDTIPLKPGSDNDSINVGDYGSMFLVEV